jgi:superfamily II DNA or RNA helicase
VGKGSPLQIGVGSLVRWRKGPAGGDVGVVAEVLNGGQRVRVRLDDGTELVFAWPTDVLQRLEFPEGRYVQIRSDGAAGMVTGRTEVGGRFVYDLALPDGSVRSVPEDSLRPARVMDPRTLLRAGEARSPFHMNLRIAATRLLFQHQFDDFSSLSNSRVEIKPHQVAVLYRAASTYPHRFLLADEVGLGKTIEAGLIIKELKARGVADRVLVLAPSGIVSQWQFELKTKFSEVFAVYNKNTIAYLQSKHPGENVWTLENNVIVSSTFGAWDDRRREEIALADWDLVIIDEAHHARRTWQGQSRYTDTNLYRLATRLADPERSTSTGMLLLTATPMQLHPFELYSLIELLDPALFPDFDEFEAHVELLAGLNKAVDLVRRWPALDLSEQAEAEAAIRRWLPAEASDPSSALGNAEERERIGEELLQLHRLSEVMVRNRKSVVGGFMPRTAKTWTVEATPQEMEAYHAVTEYVRTGLQRSRVIKNNALGFLMTTFQKMNASSSETLGKSLVRRIERLEEGLLAKAAPELGDDEDASDLSVEELDDVLAIDARLNILEELAELRRLVALLDAIGIDSKAQALRAGLADLRRTDPGVKVLVFTQFRDTQSYLARILGTDWPIGIFHGQLSPEAKDSAVATFRDQPGPQILLSTEAGGEGRNLQFCHTMVNYDLPWNPMRIEQRIGRIDRIGQRSPVTIINLAVAGTIEERVLEVLERRIQVFVDTVGGLDPILGKVEADLRHLIFLVDGDAKLTAYEADLETRVQRARAAEVRLGDLIMDTRSFRQDEVRRILEHRSSLDSQAVERFVRKALRQMSVAVEPVPELPGVWDVTFGERFAIEFPKIARDGRTRRVTFDPSVALDMESVEFLAFGHELVDGLVARVRSREFGGRAGTRLIRTSEVEPIEGWFFTYELELEGVVRSKELLPVFVDRAGQSLPDVAAWLIQKASQLKREDPPPGFAVPVDELDAAVAAAELIATTRLFERQAELADQNRSRLEQERSKVARYYEYRHRSASAKLASTARTLERLRASDNPDEIKILPVWVKNLETAQRTADALTVDRERRLGELAARDQVAAQQQMMTGAFVAITAQNLDQPDASS